MKIRTEDMGDVYYPVVLHRWEGAMPAIPMGERVKVIIEMPDGQVYDIAAYTVSMSYQHDFNFVRTHIELEAIEPVAVRAIERSQYVEKVKTAVEWLCEWCGKPNPRSATYCGQDTGGKVGCGHVRPFIYDL